VVVIRVTSVLDAIYLRFDPTGSFGAKGVAEPTCVSTAAAILNAIHDAVGVRIIALPATAEKVYTAINRNARKNRG
jgi:CO/xanthine dehydrogenase Mo-binding subunit